MGMEPVSLPGSAAATPERKQQQQPSPENGAIKVAKQPSPENGASKGVKQPSPENGTSKGVKQPSPENGSSKVVKQPSPENGASKVSKQPSPDNRTNRVAKQPSPDNRANKGAKQLSPDNGASKVVKQPSPDNRGNKGAKQLSPDNGANKVAKQPSPDNRASKGAKQISPDNGANKGGAKQSISDNGANRSAKQPSPDNAANKSANTPNRKKTPSSPLGAGMNSAISVATTPARSPAPSPAPVKSHTPSTTATAGARRRVGRRTTFKKSGTHKVRKESEDEEDAAEVASDGGGKDIKDEQGRKTLGNIIKKGTPSSDEEEEGRLKQGPWFLKLAKTYHSQGDNPTKAFQFASRAVQCFEKSAAGRSSLDLVVSLHILASLQCRQGHFEEAAILLKRALTIPDPGADGIEHTLATFAGHMQLGDTLNLQGKHQLALDEYQSALKLQKLALGDLDIRVAETCRYVAEAHLQAMQFHEAGELCDLALKIHQEKSESGSMEEAADRRLMAMVCSGKGDHEAALEHLVLSSTVFLANGLESDVAAVDSTIGDALFALGRDTEAALSYQKALTVFKATKGETHAVVASVFVRLADLALKTGKARDAKTYCDSALRIFGTQGAGHALEDIVYGLADIAGIYQLLGEREQAITLLSRAVDIQGSAPGQTYTAAGIEAQLGILYFMAEKFPNAYSALKSSVSKFKSASDGKKTLFLGLLLNQLGLTAVELGEIVEAKGVLEESRSVMDESVGPNHPDTLSICSNLAGTYDALGRTREAIKLLESVLEVKESQIGSVHPEVEEERLRLQQLLRDVGRIRTRKSNTLKELLHMAIEEGNKR